MMPTKRWKALQLLSYFVVSRLALANLQGLPVLLRIWPLMRRPQALYARVMSAGQLKSLVSHVGPGLMHQVSPEVQV